MVTRTEVHFPESSGLQASIDRFTRKDENGYLDALGLAERLFDDHMAANLIVLGAAYQAGAIPVAAQAIERAIALNGVSVEMNPQAFRAGRLAVADPAWAKTIKPRRVGAVETAITLGVWTEPAGQSGGSGPGPGSDQGPGPQPQGGSEKPPKESNGQGKAKGHDKKDNGGLLDLPGSG